METMTAAITPERVLRAIDRHHPWYGRGHDTEDPERIVPIQITYNKFHQVMEDEKITFVERTIKEHWTKLKKMGFYEEVDENRARSVPEKIAKALRVKMTYWKPASSRGWGQQHV